MVLAMHDVNWIRLNSFQQQLEAFCCLWSGTLPEETLEGFFSETCICVLPDQTWSGVTAIREGIVSLCSAFGGLAMQPKLACEHGACVHLWFRWESANWHPDIESSVAESNLCYMVFEVDSDKIVRFWFPWCSGLYLRGLGRTSAYLSLPQLQHRIFVNEGGRLLAAEHFQKPVWLQIADKLIASAFGHLKLSEADSFLCADLEFVNGDIQGRGIAQWKTFVYAIKTAFSGSGPNYDIQLAVQDGNSLCLIVQINFEAGRFFTLDGASGMWCLLRVSFKANKVSKIETRPDNYVFFLGTDYPKHAERVAQLFQGKTIAPIANSQATHSMQGPHDVVLVGMSGRFPGADCIQQFWENLQSGQTFFTKFPYDRPYLGNTTEIEFAGFLDDVFSFDAEYFNMTPVAAQFVDPQHRLLLETIVQCIEDSGSSLESVSGDRTALCLSSLSNDFEKLLRSYGVAENYHYWAGTEHAMLPGRVAGFLDIRGPTHFVNAECTGGIAALHLAVQSIQNGTVDQAIVASSSLFLHSYGFTVREKGILSRGSAPKLFSKTSDGQLRGEAVVALRLKSRAKAEQDGDDILAIVAGTALKNSGRSFSLIAANVAQYVQTIQDAWTSAGLHPAQISAIECSASGVREGDFAEIAALNRVVAGTKKTRISNVKGAVGHTESASGLVSLVKMALQIRHKKLIRMAGVDEIDPALNLDSAKLEVLMHSQYWDTTPDYPRRIGGINAFAGGGYNTHTVLAEPLPGTGRHIGLPVHCVFPFSAQSIEVLSLYLRDISDFLTRVPCDIARVAFTLQQRECRQWRILLFADSVGSLLEQMATILPSHFCQLETGVSQSPYFDSQAQPDTDSLSKAWLAGESVDWNVLWKHGLPVRLSGLPCRKFKGGQCLPPIPESAVIALTADETSGQCTLYPTNPFLIHHKVNDQCVLPGVAELVIVQQAAMAQVLRSQAQTVTGLEFSNVAWIHPVSLEAHANHVTLAVELEDSGTDPLRFQLRQQQRDIPHLAGYLGSAAPAAIDASFKEASVSWQRHLSGEQCYQLLTLMGIEIGASCRAILDLKIGMDIQGRIQAEARLQFCGGPGYAPFSAAEARFIGILDAALQCSFIASLRPADRYIVQAVPIPFAADRIVLSGELDEYVRAKIVISGQTDDAETRSFDLEIQNDSGQRVIAVQGFSVRVANLAVQQPDHRSHSSLPDAVLWQSSVLSADLASELRNIVASATGLAAGAIHERIPFAQLGIDSAQAVLLTQKLEQRFGPLSKTLLFEHKTLAALTGFLQSRQAVSGSAYSVGPSPMPVAAQLPPQSEQGDGLGIAIVGISGRFPGASSVTEFAVQLASGTVAISEVPPERWRGIAATDLNGACQWGGFLDDINAFDNSFFGLSEQEAELTDPQEKLLLQHAWLALEDAACNPAELAGSAVGIYVASMYSDFQLFGNGQNGLVSSQGQLANRLSYFLDVTGPSLTLDTMCSSSLVALQRACSDLTSKQTELSVVGAVNLSQHPDKYLTLARRGLLSTSAFVDSFGEGADGYIPGEAVGVVVLKRLSDALANKDHIYGVLRGIAVNQSGKSNGFGVPDPAAQQAVIERALEQAGIPAERLDYLEAHGSGTRLGDLIEFSALQAVFGRRKLPLPMGCVKSSVGHGEAASGMTALIKCLLQFKREQLFPTVAKGRRNPDIDFKNSKIVFAETSVPLAVRSFSEPLIAGISSFGAGGTNAHLIVQSAPLLQTAALKLPGFSWALIVSAKSQRALKCRVKQLLEVLEACKSEEEFHRILFTLQCGREAMSERAGWMVSGLEQARDKLQAYFFHDICEADSEVSHSTPSAAKALVDQRAMLSAWLSGSQVAWLQCYGQNHPARIPLPGYPFELSLAKLDTVVRSEPDKQSIQPERDRQFEFLWRSDLELTEKSEKLLLCLLENTLGAPVPSVLTPFSSLGLSSVHVVAFVDCWQSLFGKRINAAAFYRCKTVQQLAKFVVEEALISAQAIAEAASLLDAGKPDADDPFSPFPLSDLQAAFVIGRELKTCGNKVGSTIFFELALPPGQTLANVQVAWNQLVQAHAGLHTMILDVHHQQRMKGVKPYQFQYTNLSHLCRQDADLTMEQSRTELRCKVFPLSVWPYFEIRWFEQDHKGSRLQCAFDEVVADAASIFILIRQWMQAVTTGLKPVVIDYTVKDYLLQQEQLKKSRHYDTNMQYWCTKLAQMPAGSVLSCDHNTRDEVAPVRCLSGQLSASLWLPMKVKAERIGVTPAALLLTLFCDALHQYTGEMQFSLVLTTMNRMAVAPGVRELVGLLAGSQMYLADANAELSFRERAIGCQQQLDADAGHPGVSAVHILRTLKAQGKLGKQVASNVVFSNMLDQSFDIQELGGGWELVDMMNTTPQVTLDHHVFQRADQLVWRWYVSSALLQSGAIYQIFELYQNLLLDRASAENDWSDRVHSYGNRIRRMNGLQQKLLWGRKIPVRRGGRDCISHLEFHIESLSTDRLASAWKQLVASQPALRGLFVSLDSCEIQQGLDNYQLEVRQGSENEQEFSRMCSAVRRTLLDNHNLHSRFPDSSIRVCTRQQGFSVVFIHFDLICVDGPGIVYLLTQLFKKYHNPAYTIPASSTNFSPDKCTVSQQKKTEAKRYWETRLAEVGTGPQALCSLAQGQCIPDRLHRKLPWRIPLEQLAGRYAVTVDCILLAAYGQTLLQLNNKLLQRNESVAVAVVTWDRSGSDNLSSGLGTTRCCWVRFSNEPQGLADLVISVSQQIQQDLSFYTVDPFAELETSADLVCPAVYTQLLDWPVNDIPEPDYSLSCTPSVVVDFVPHLLGEQFIQLQWDISSNDVFDWRLLFHSYLSLLGEWLNIECGNNVNDDLPFLSGQRQSKTGQTSDSDSSIRNALLQMAEDLL